MLSITKELAESSIAFIRSDVESVLSLFWEKYYCYGKSYKYRICFYGFGRGYEKTAAYALPILSLHQIEQECYVTILKQLLLDRKISPENLFNSIVLIDSILPFVDRSEWKKYVAKLICLKSPILHVEAYRLALCARIGHEDISDEINQFHNSISNIKLNDIQQINSFYGKKNGATEHEFAYLCLGVLSLAYYSGDEKLWLVVDQLFEMFHVGFVKRKKYILNGSTSREDCAANGLMSCFLFTLYFIKCDYRALNAACYLIENLDSYYKSGDGFPASGLPFISWLKRPSWSMAYYSVAKILHAGALKKFEKDLVR